MRHAILTASLWAVAAACGFAAVDADTPPDATPLDTQQLALRGGGVDGPGPGGGPCPDMAGVQRGCECNVPSVCTSTGFYCERVQMQDFDECGFRLSTKGFSCTETSGDDQCGQKLVGTPSTGNNCALSDCGQPNSGCGAVRYTVVVTRCQPAGTGG